MKLTAYSNDALRSVRRAAHSAPDQPLSDIAAKCGEFLSRIAQIRVAR